MDQKRNARIATMISSRIKYVIDKDQVMIDTMTDLTYIRLKHMIKAVVYDYLNFPLKVKAKDVYYIHNNKGGVWRT